MIRWLLAKYVADPMRYEAKNIGLILLRGDEVAMRFVGQRTDGSIDGRSVRHVRSLPTYKAWVEHWRRLAAGGADALIAAAGKDQRSENYRMEPGGEIVAGADPGLPTDFLRDHLYERYVGPIPLGRDERVTAGGRSFDDVVRAMLSTPPLRSPQRPPTG